MLAIHLLGDAISPHIIGVLSDHSNLGMGLGYTLVTLVVAAVVFTVGARFAPPLEGVTAAR